MEANAIFLDVSRELHYYGQLAQEELGPVAQAPVINIKTGGVKFAASIHLFFDFAVNAYRWMFRIGGQPILSAPVSPAKGSDTESHFVTLATRP